MQKPNDYDNTQAQGELYGWKALAYLHAHD